MDNMEVPPAQQGNSVVESKVVNKDPALSEDEEGKVNISRAILEGFVAYDKQLSDVEITPESTNPVKKNHAEPCTRLNSIGGHVASLLKIDDMRMFCVRNQIPGARKASKFQLCQAIAEARVKFDNGLSPPYTDCFVYSDKEQQLAMDIDLTDHDIINPAAADSNKRSREDFEEGAAAMELRGDNNTSIHLSISDRGNQKKLVALQSRIVQSVEMKNMAIYLKETIESASAIRRELREERKQRDGLWEKLVEQAGDEGAAFSKYATYRKARLENESGLEGVDGELVKQMPEQTLEDLYEEDSLIQQLKQQHVKLNETVSKLL